MKRLLAIVVMGAAAALVAAPAGAQDVPFTGQVVQEGVQARAGAGRRYYVVGEVPQGTRVRVDEVFYGWNKVVPPEGVYSYISKAFVDASGDGKTGTVTKDNQDVKAASVQAPGESYRVQTTLDRGDTVRIVGEEGSYYKIIPPDDAYVFLPPGSVQRVDEPVEQPEPSETSLPAPDAAEENEPPPAEPAAEPEPEPEAEAEPQAPAEPQPQTPTLEVSEANQPAAPAYNEPIALEKGGQQVDWSVRSDNLAELEAQMKPLLVKPVAEQPIDRMIAAYESLDQSQLSDQEKRVVSLRLRALRDNKRLAETLSQINQVQRQVDEGTVLENMPRPLAPSDYDVTGTLTASAVYSGETLPRLYKVVSGEGLTLAWVLPRSPVSPQRHLGKLVGILGERQYDDALKQHIYVVRRIDVLEPATSATATAEVESE